MTRPEISPCLYCKSDCHVAGGVLWGLHHPMASSAPWVACSNSVCGYRGPFGVTPEEAITKHNLICRPSPSVSVREAAEAAALEILRFLSEWGEDEWTDTNLSDIILRHFATGGEPAGQGGAQCPRCKQVRKAYEVANNHLSIALEVISKQLAEDSQ